MEVCVCVWPHDTAYLRRRKCSPEGSALLLDLVVEGEERRGGEQYPVASLTHRAPRERRRKVYQATKFCSIVIRNNCYGTALHPSGIPQGNGGR